MHRTGRNGADRAGMHAKDERLVELVEALAISKEHVDYIGWDDPVAIIAAGHFLFVLANFILINLDFKPTR